MQQKSGETARRLRVYLAAPLFSEAERTFNVLVTRRLEESTEVYLPQRDGGLMSEMVRDGVPANIAACRVFRRDMHAIRQADYMIAILDGRAIDEGAAFELGVAFSHAKRCVGLQTDSRRLASWGNNPMITGALETVFDSLEGLLAWVRGEASAALSAPSAETQPTLGPADEVASEVLSLPPSMYGGSHGGDPRNNDLL